MRALLGGAVGALALACAPAAYVITTATPAGATTVSNEAQLRSAFDTDGQITLANDITLTDCGSGDVDRNTSDAALVLEGAGHTITQTCPDVRVLDVNTNSAVTLRDVTVTGGNTGGDGGGINMSSNNGGGGDLTVERSTFTGNTGCDGGAIHALPDGSAVSIVASTIAGNTANSDGGAVDMDNEDNLTLTNSTVTKNSSVDTAALDVDSPGVLSLVYATVVANTEGTTVCPDSVSADDDPVSSSEADPDGVHAAQIASVNISAESDPSIFRSFGSVVALHGGGLPNCDVVNPDSQGYNFSDDSTCGFTATGDRQDAGDPGLGALAGNGGPTQTMLPGAGSPLLDAIPPGSCQADGAAGVSTDQRGITRPQGSGCDIGAVEVEVVAPAPIVITVTPTFTG